MIIKSDEELSKYTSLRIGGKAKEVYFPESQNELVDLVKDLANKKEPFRIMGNGTNILINDKGIKEIVINNRHACKYIEFKDNGIVEVGSSYDFRFFIREVIDRDLAGPSSLIGIPGSIGGAIYMNAGLGASSNINISDHLVYVIFFDGQEIKNISKEECHFSYRHSIFKENKNWLILGAVFKYESQAKEIGKAKLFERLDHIKDRSYLKFRSAGSIFRASNFFIMKRLRGLSIGDAEYSKTMNNVIHNVNGRAKFSEVLMLINIAKILHLLLFKKAKLEVEIWK